MQWTAIGAVIGIGTGLFSTNSTLALSGPIVKAEYRLADVWHLECEVVDRGGAATAGWRAYRTLDCMPP